MVSLISFEDRVIALGSKVRPVWLRKRLFSLLFSLYFYVNRLKTIIFQFQLPVYVVSGVEKTSGQTIRFLFVGRGRFPLFLIDLLFTRAPDVEQIGIVFVWRLSKLDRFLSSHDVDAVLVSCDRFYQKWLLNAGLFVFPLLVDLVLDVSEPFDVFYKGLSHSAKEDIKKVKKQGYSYEVFSDVDYLKLFYENMYLPLIKSRFADEPLYTPPFSFFNVLHMIGYRLLLVKDASGDFVSGCYFHGNGNEVLDRYLGVMNGDLELIKKGAESACYCFIIDWVKNNKYNKIDLGGCLPFINDGVLRYKQKWGAKIRRCAGTYISEVFGVKVVKEKSPLNDFFKRNPIFGVDENNDLKRF